MKVKFMHKASIVNVFEPREEYCARCSRKNDCRGSLILLEYHGVRNVICVSQIPREELEKARQLGEPIFFDETGHVSLKNFEG